MMSQRKHQMPHELVRVLIGERPLLMMVVNPGENVLKNSSSSSSNTIFADSILAPNAVRIASIPGESFATRVDKN
jgi:hypothetical protein